MHNLNFSAMEAIHDQYAASCDPALPTSDSDKRGVTTAFRLNMALQKIPIGNLMKKLHEQGACRPERVKDERESLAARIIAAQEEERARLARDLHDDICQQLALLALDLSRLRIGMSASVGRTGIDAALRKLENVIADIHGLSHRLHPSIVRDLGPVAAIKAECRHFAGQLGIPVHFTPHAPVGKLSEENGLALFRIVQEALQNVAKHAQASDVHVSLERLVDNVCLRIEDSGVGFDIDDAQGGLGLASMRERVALAHGALAISSARGRGTLIEVIVPARLAPTPAPMA
jgi:two-component system, NarL family, sensor kinase